MLLSTLEIQGIDRIGITHDVITCVTKSSLDIIGMEVKPGTIYLKISTPSIDLLRMVQGEIRRVPGVKMVQAINYLPAEERENRMDAILATITEGIISVDEHLQIKTINRAAQEMLQPRAERVIGMHIETLWGQAAQEIARCLDEGTEISHVQVNLPKKRTGTEQVICSYRPVVSTRLGERKQGVVIVLRDMKQITELIQSVQKTGVFTFEEIVHQSAEMRQCISTAKRIAGSNATIFLQGESGTGKDLFARAIHFESPRAGRPFVPINCAAIPESLLESELFGYEEGAFTGAIKGGKPGLFEMAQGGTLFLDEIGEIPLHLQAKLLRVLEDRTVRRIGSGRSIPVDVRIIAATNRNLAAMTTNGQFREDLFYRLHVIPIRIPPLRERRSDIPLLADFFVQKICRQMGRPPLALSPSAMRALQEHKWPGNVRQLQNAIERAVYLCPDTEIHADHLYGDDTLGEKERPAAPPGLKQQVDAYEKMLLADALKEHKSARQAAGRLGISHTAVLKKMKKYGLLDG